MTDSRTRAGGLADRIEAELRRLRCWQADPPRPDPARDGPFGTHTMAFEQWLQVVLVPALREIAAAEMAMPRSSQVAVHAEREFDGRDDRGALLDLLRQVDALCPSPATARSERTSRPVWMALVLLLAWVAPSALLAEHAATLVLGAPATRGMLTASVPRGSGTWSGLQVSGRAEQQGDRLQFTDVVLVLDPGPGASGRARRLHLHPDAAKPLVGGEFTAAGLLRAAGVDAAPRADTEALFSWLAALREPVREADLTAQFAAFAAAAGATAAPQAALRRHRGGHGDGAWVLGFCLVYLPIAIAALRFAARRRRRG